MSEACTYYLELMSLVIDGESSEEENKELLQHVLQCAQCRSELRQLWEMHETFSEWQEQEVPEGFAQSVMDRIHADEATAVTPSTAPKRLQSNAKILPLWKVLGSIAACAVVCVGLWRFAAPPQSPSQPDPSPASYAANTPLNTSTPIKSLTADPTSSQNESGTPDTKEVVTMVSDALGTVPGTILVLEELPEDLEGTQYTSETGDTILVPKTEDITQLLTQLPSPLMEISGKDGPVVLVVLK